MNRIIQEKGDWISVDYHWDDCDGLNGIEELTDYELLTEFENNTKNEKTKSIHSHGTAKKAIKRKKSKNKYLTETKTKRKTVTPEDNRTTEKNDNDDLDVDMTAWKDCFVPEPVLKALKDLHFTYPTPIQALVLPSAIRDRMDILGAAETGSGKTLAFGIPLIHYILEDKEREMRELEEVKHPLRALVITPTRELAIQVKNHLRMAAKYTDIKIVVVVGGMSQQKQERLLRRCPDIVVATPGRLWELIDLGNSHLSQVPNIKYLVIDEADRMVEKGHFSELLQLLELVNSSGQTNRHTYVFSATLTLMHEMPKRIIFKKKRKFKMTNDKKIGDLIEIIGMKEKHKVIDLTRKVGTVETLTETRIHCSLEEKDLYMYYFLAVHPGRTLVFCNSIDCVRRLKSVLTVLGYNPLPLHASMHQRQRLKNLDRFSSDPNGLLLATDVAARGLDILNIEHVIHYQVPRTAEIYVHRSGRTARSLKEGLSVMFIEPKEIVYYKKLCNTLNRDEELPMFPVDTSLMRPVKERVTLAHRIDKIQHTQRKQSAQNRWLEAAAREMDIDLDEEELHMKKESKHQKELKLLQNHLSNLTKKPLRLQQYCGSYLTKSGKLFLNQEIVPNWKEIKSSRSNKKHKRK